MDRHWRFVRPPTEFGFRSPTVKIGTGSVIKLTPASSRTAPVRPSTMPRSVCGFDAVLPLDGLQVGQAADGQPSSSRSPRSTIP
jgi:hypothetical protein